MSQHEPCWDLTTWEGLRDLVLFRSRLSYPGERGVVRIAVHCLWRLRYFRRENEALRAEVKRLRQRCAVCKHEADDQEAFEAWIDSDREANDFFWHCWALSGLPEASEHGGQCVVVQEAVR